MTVRRRVTALVPIVGALGLALASCTAGTSPGAPGQTGSDSRPAGQTPTPTVPPVALTPSVADGASAVPVSTVVKVTATSGTVTDVKMSYAAKKDGKAIAIPGTLATDGTGWTANDRLEPGVTYTLEMSGRNGEGTATTTTSTFSSAELGKNDEILVTLLNQDGATYGTAMPIIVTFDLPVEDKAAFERRMKVSATPAVNGAWRWISPREAHWRPENVWAPGTKVSVNLDLNGIPAGGGRFGEQSRSADFTIGRSIQGFIDLKTHQMTVKEGDNVLKTIPISGGKPSSETRSGVKVIMAKRSNFEMRAETLGLKEGDSEWYAPVHVDYALQVTRSGEFLHSAPWASAAHGVRNVSHACVGMSVANSKWLYDTMNVGDMVTVTGSGRGMTLGNGWADWNLSFADWAKGSALAGEPAAPPAAAPTPSSAAVKTVTPPAAKTP